MNDVPFVRNVSGLLGLGDQTLPLPNLWGSGKALVEAVGNSGVLSGETGEALAGLVAEIAPGGRQMKKKTMQGVKTMRKGGRVYGYGENERLQYPVEDTAGNWVKAVMFGNTGLRETSSFYASGLSGLSKSKPWCTVTWWRGVRTAARYTIQFKPCARLRRRRKSGMR